MNGGYHFFESEEDCNNWLEAVKRRKAVTDFFRNYQSPTDEQMDKIHDILFGGEHE